MKKLAKLLSILLVTTMSFSVIGCTKTEADVAKTENKNPEKIENIVIWQPEQALAEAKVYEDAVNALNEANKDKFKVELVSIPRGNGYEYENKINAAATSGDLPDVIFMDGPTIANYSDAEIIQPMDEFFTKEELSDFVPSVITQGTVDGKLYALSPSESSVVLYYNKKMLADASITPPDKLEDAWSLEEVYENAKKLNKDGVFGINLSWDLGEGQIYGLAPIIWSNGSELLSEDGRSAEGFVNSDKAVEAMKLYQKFATENIMSLQTLPNDFPEGKSAMYLTGSWEVQNLKDNFPDFEYGITYYPKTDPTGKTISPSGDWAFGITTISKNKEYAAEVIKYLTSVEVVTAYSSAINKPASRISVLEKQDIHPVIKEQVQKTAHPRPISVSYPVLSKEFANATQDIRTGADIKEALSSVATRFEDDIKRNQ